MNGLPGATPAEILCLNCGLCCNGTLHNWTQLRSQEVSRAGADGLLVFTRRDGSPAFRQPCRAFQEPACTIYTQRPHACRDYVCPLLQSMNAGEITLAEALQHTRQVRQWITALRAQMPDPDSNLPLDWQVRLNWKPEEPLPDDIRSTFDQLAGLLKERWKVTWRRKPARRRH